MGTKTIKTIFSWVLLVGFLIPMGINFAHSFEDHEHIVCNAKKLKHFHQSENDCSSLHYNTQSFVYSISQQQFVFIKKISTKVLLNNTSNYLGVAIPLKSSRAPPIII